MPEKSNNFRSCLIEYLNRIKAANKSRKLNKGQKAEDPLKFITIDFIVKAAKVLDCRSVSGYSEIDISKPVDEEFDKIKGKKRIDISINDSKSGLQIGFIELKQNTVPVDFKSLNEAPKESHNYEQFRYFMKSPISGRNLIYCNGLQWTKIRNGTLDREILLPLSPNDLTDEQINNMESMIRGFLTSNIIPPQTVLEFAKSLAIPTREIQKKVIASFDGSREYEGIKKYWEDLLVTEISNEDFSDYFAQTVTYYHLTKRFENNDSSDTSIVGERLLQSVYDLITRKNVSLIKGELNTIQEIINSVDPKLMEAKNE